MKPEGLVLYHYWRSSCSWRLRWALKLKGVVCELKHINLLEGEHKTKAYLKLNPSGQVPCLKTKEDIATESLAIIEWLDELICDPKLIGGSPEKRRKIREFSYKIASGIQPIQNLGVMRAHSSQRSEQVAWAKLWIEKGLGVCEKLLEKTATKYCFGSELSLADLCLVPQVYNAKRFAVKLESYPKVQRIYDNCLETEACQASHPDQFKPS